jgi:elongation factor G
VAERLGAVEWVQEKELLTVERLVAGDIGAVTKLKETKTGDTLAAKEAALRMPPVRIPEPKISFAITPKSKGDWDKIAAALAQIQDEDPSLHVSRDSQTKELLLSGSAQLHVEIPVARLAKRYKVERTLQPPKVPYRETIPKPAEVTTWHKKQTGGHGQFAEAKIRLEPLLQGGGYEFVDKIFGGALSQRERGFRWWSPLKPSPPGRGFG